MADEPTMGATGRASRGHGLEECADEGCDVAAMWLRGRVKGRPQETQTSLAKWRCVYPRALAPAGRDVVQRLFCLVLSACDDESQDSKPGANNASIFYFPAEPAKRSVRSAEDIL